jgi:hypothetical protein
MDSRIASLEMKTMLYAGILTTCLAGIKKKASHIDIERLLDPPRKSGGVYLFRYSSVTTLVRRGDQRRDKESDLSLAAAFASGQSYIVDGKGGSSRRIERILRIVPLVA